MTTLDQLKAAKAACPALLRATTEQKNQALSAMADALLHHEADILLAHIDRVLLPEGPCLRL